MMVRRARPGERDAVLATLVAAFTQDPQLRWYFPDGVAGEGGERFFGVLLDTRLEGGEVWTDDGLRAAALWVPPGGNLLGPAVTSARYAAAMADLPGPAPERVARADAAVEQLLPRGPHWYLGVLACRPEHRGRGLASAVLRPVLASADRTGTPVALETATDRNVCYYARHGFREAGARDLGPGAPVLHVLVRPPAAG